MSACPPFDGADEFKKIKKKAERERAPNLLDTQLF